MNQSINTDSKNSKEPQQKYRLGTVSIKILGGLNRKSGCFCIIRSGGLNGISFLPYRGDKSDFVLLSVDQCAD